MFYYPFWLCSCLKKYALSFFLLGYNKKSYGRCDTKQFLLNDSWSYFRPIKKNSGKKKTSPKQNQKKTSPKILPKHPPYFRSKIQKKKHFLVPTNFGPFSLQKVQRSRPGAPLDHQSLFSTLVTDLTLLVGDGVWLMDALPAFLGGRYGRKESKYWDGKFWKKSHYWLYLDLFGVFFQILGCAYHDEIKSVVDMHVPTPWRGNE